MTLWRCLSVVPYCFFYCTVYRLRFISREIKAVTPGSLGIVCTVVINRRWCPGMFLKCKTTHRFHHSDMVLSLLLLLFIWLCLIIGGMLWKYICLKLKLHLTLICISWNDCGCAALEKYVFILSHQMNQREILNISNSESLPRHILYMNKYSYQTIIQFF